MIEDFNELAKGLVKRHENLLLELRDAARNLGVEPPERPESDVTVDEIQEQFPACTGQLRGAVSAA